MNAETAPHTANPFSSFTIASLIDGAARLRPEASCLIEDGVVWSTARVAEAAEAFAGSLAAFGLKPRERIALSAAADARGLIALFGACKSGLDVALAPLDLDGRALAAYARAAGARAILGPARFVDLDMGQRLFEAAAAADSVRIVATFGPEAVDGAVHLDPVALTRADARGPASTAEAGPRLFARSRETTNPVELSQGALVAAAFDFVARLGVRRDSTLASLIQPVSFAGLACGPIAALLTGAPMQTCAPLRRDTLAALLSPGAHRHVTAPAALGPQLVEAAGAAVAAPALLTRCAALGGVTPEPLAAPCPAFDLYAIDERAAVAEKREFGGVPVAPALSPHYVTFDGARVLTMQRRWDGALEGAGVNEGDGR